MLFRKHAQDEDRASPEEIQDSDVLRSKRGTVFLQNLNPLTALKKLVGQSQNILLTLKTVYPFDLSPDTITIDINKVNIIKKEAFGSENVHSILIDDITNVSVNTGLFTGSLEIIDSANLRYPITYTVKHLKNRSALKARRLIQGLIAAKRAGVDLSECEDKDILECLYDLGFAKGENEK